MFFLLKATGHVISVETTRQIGLGNITDRVLELVQKLRNLSFDANEYICLKFLILLNPGMWSNERTSIFRIIWKMVASVISVHVAECKNILKHIYCFLLIL